MTVAPDLRAELLAVVPDEKRFSAGESVRRLHGEDVLHHFEQLFDPNGILNPGTIFIP